VPDDPQDEVQQPVLIVIRKTPDATAAAPAPDAPDVPAVASADVPAADPNPPQTQATDFLSIVTQAGLTAAGLFSGDGDGAPSAPGQEQPATDSNAAEGLNFANFFAIFGALETLQGLVANLLASPDVAAAYIQPVPELPVWDAPASGSGGATGPAPSGATPDFSAHQGYLNPAPEGIDALYAWTCAGGKGAGVQIIDIEGGWQVSHEDLAQNQGGIIGGAAFTGQHWVDHGTAVLGEFSGDDNGFGVTGICPDATVSMISHRTATPAVQIKLAADKLNAGDILLLEMHQPGPAYNFQSRDDQLGYIAVEFWPDIWASIKYATNKGIIVIEAAGNGAQNFDDPIYNTAPTGWPAGWTNPFARGSYDSGAILVGAGSPPPTTHGKDQVPGGGNLTTDRARLSFSNYGAAVDVQGWGLEVTSTGYGDLQGGTDQNFWYTDSFGGTSGASPIVVGAVGCMQGVRKAASLAVLTPDQVRNIFRTTGSPQQDGVFGAATQNIGNRPDLKAILPLIISTIYNANDGVTPASDGTAAA
jgi:hypothetical protein